MKFRYRRLLSWIRRRYPLTLYLPFFIVGQVGGEWFSLEIASILFVLVACAFARWRSVGFLLLLSTSAGTVTAARPAPYSPPTNSFPTVLGLIDQNPRYRRTGEIEISIRDLAKGYRFLCKGPHLPWKNVHQVAADQIVYLRGKFRPLNHHGWPFHFDNQLRREGYSATCKILWVAPADENRISSFSRAREFLLQSLYQTFGDNEDTGFLLSLTLGVRDQLGVHTDSAFQKLGLAHLLVFSGYQVTLLYGFLFTVVRKVLMLSPRIVTRLPSRAAFFVPPLICAAGLALLSGAESSALRATMALFFVVGGRLLERPPSFLNLCLTTLLFLHLVAPASLLNPSIQLTFAALTGIYLGGSSTRGRVLQFLSVSFYTWLATSIIVIAWFRELSLYGLPANLVFALPLSILSCIGGGVTLFLFWCGFDQEGVGVRCVIFLLSVLKQIVLWASDTLPSPEKCPEWLLIALALTFSAIVLRRLSIALGDSKITELRFGLSSHYRGFRGEVGP